MLFIPEDLVIHQLPPYREDQRLLDRLVHLLGQEAPCLQALPSLHQVPVVQDDLYLLLGQRVLVDQKAQKFHLDQLLPNM